MNSIRIDSFRFVVVADYDKSLEEMINANNYRGVYPDINERNCPTEARGKKRLTVTLCHFDDLIHDDDARAEIKRQGFRSATLKELLAIDKRHPHLKSANPIVALDSTFRDEDGNQCIASIDGVCGGYLRSSVVGEGRIFPRTNFAIVQEK